MNIRPAYDTDIPAIIALLRASLGESLLPKSEALWRWKHQTSPFGKSYVLVAEENNELIGLRAFMQWQWQWQSQTFRAIRAVDTATHPLHQGKGIFKKLTLQQIELCKSDGIHFVFNTPNEQSRPGYLKMGWEAQGRMPMKLQLHTPISIVTRKLLRKQPFPTNAPDPTPVCDWSGIAALTVNDVTPYQGIHTATQPAYIQWRYADNPLYRYGYLTDHKHYLLIYRFKHQGFAKEMRITDFFPLSHAPASQVSHHLVKAVQHLRKEHRISFTSMSGNHYLLHRPYFKWLGPIPVRNMGPIVTIKDVNATAIMDSLLDSSNWQYTLGDMELF
jgi:GNAT superfamily N-acetyltransferase